MDRLESLALFVTAVESVFLDGGRKRAVQTLENRFS
jgi:hypothetical protein